MEFISWKYGEHKEVLVMAEYLGKEVTLAAAYL
jgi:hypothetical protein